MHDGLHDQNTELLDSELLKDAESTSQLPAHAAPAEELRTTRLPRATPPPPPLHAMHIATSSMPPLPMSFPPPAPVPAIGAGSTQPLSQQPVQAPSHHYAHAAAPAAARPSWLRQLLATTFPPPAAPSDSGVSAQTTAAARRSAAIACVGFALVFALVAMVSGLRGAPDDASMAPAVAAALVVAHALVAIGAGAFSFGLLRMAERLLAER
jgi:hypothetical protein